MGGVGAFGTIGFTGTMDNKPPPPRAARRAAAWAGCRFQVKIYMPYVVRAGGLALLTNEKSRWPGRPVGLLMVGRVRGSTPRGGTAVGSPL